MLPSVPTREVPKRPRHNKDHPAVSQDIEGLITDVGILEHSSAMDMATHWMKIMAIIHPQTIPPVPA
jgi:hypothetical protein